MSRTDEDSTKVRTSWGGSNRRPIRIKRKVRLSNRLRSSKLDKITEPRNGATAYKELYMHIRNWLLGDI